MTQVFSEDWFKLHQKILIRLLQFGLFKKILDVEGNVVAIFPSNYIIKTKENIYKHNFRTHNKYAKRLYYRLKFLWYLLHFWDQLIARFIPRVCFGFDSLTFYPDASTGATTTDGNVSRSNAGDSWATLISSAGTAANPTGSDAPVFGFSANFPVNWQTNIRAIYNFDTSSLGSGATISAATFSLYGTTMSASDGNTPNLALMGATPANDNNLVAGDYNQLGTTEFATRVDWGSLVTGAYNDVVLNATGIAAINLTGITKLGVINGNYDLDAVEPAGAGTGNSTSFNANYADQTGTVNDPKLVITYTPGFKPKLIYY